MNTTNGIFKFTGITMHNAVIMESTIANERMKYGLMFLKCQLKNMLLFLFPKLANKKRGVAWGKWAANDSMPTFD
jgi:hypothetical protein